MNKLIKIFTIINLCIFFMLNSGCTNKDQEKEQDHKSVFVERLIFESNNGNKDIDIESANKIYKLLSEVSWENAAVSMDRMPDFKIKVNVKDPPINKVYAIWNTPNQDKFELIIEGEKKYIKLTKDDSNKLRKLLNI